MWSRMLKDAVMPTTQTTVRQPVEHDARGSGNEFRENLSANSGGEQEQRGHGHPDEQFDLVMQQAAVVEQSDHREQRGAGENSDDLLMRRAAEREQNGEHESEIDGDAAEQRNGAEVDFARAGMVHHPVTQREAANRDGQKQRADKGHGKGDQIGRDGHRAKLRPTDCDPRKPAEQAGKNFLTIPKRSMGFARHFFDDSDKTLKFINSSIFF